MSNSPTPEDERQDSFYDLLCQVVDPKQARHVTRILTELCHCDEHSFPFLLGVLNITQLRFALTLPEAVAQGICTHLDEFHKKSQLLLEALNHQQIVESKRVAQSVANSGWPLSRTYQGKIACRFQSIIRYFEEKTAYRNRWLLLLCFTIATSCLVGLNRHYRSRCTILENSSNEQLANLEKQCAASIDQRAAELANAKLQNLEPRSYALAQILEKYCHRVELTPGNFAWKLKIYPPKDLPWPSTTYNDDLTTAVTVYLPDTNGEISLSKTAPRVNPEPGKKP